MHSRNTVRYYILVAAFLVLLFFTNDFGLLDIQKTALIMAVGIDREQSTFIVTTQIAIPQSAEQSGPSQSVQIESRGDTVADAIRQINAKTGWYPKLVFCNLIVLGEEAVKQNVFDALDFFLRDEYMSDNCYVAACEGTAKQILETTTPIDPISSVAAQKVLSNHSKQVGTVAPNTLREFAIGYFSNNRSGFLPILKAEKQQESKGQESGQNDQQQNGENNGQKEEAAVRQIPAPDIPVAGGGGGGSGSSGSSGQSGGGEAQKPDMVFSASETALFYDGIAVEKLTREETFAFCMVKNKLQLASYPIESEGVPYTLHVKKNKSSLKLSIDDNSMAKLKIKVKATAGLWATSYSQTITEISNTGQVPPEIFKSAEALLKKQISNVFEKSRKSGCDAFDVLQKLQKYERKYYSAFQENILDRLILDVNVEFESLR